LPDGHRAIRAASIHSLITSATSLVPTVAAAMTQPHEAGVARDLPDPQPARSSERTLDFAWLGAGAAVVIAWIAFLAWAASSVF
jgi:hypothetical protein